MSSAIETTGLARTFGRLDAVRGLDLRVPAGSMFALIGPNGAGKTTTIKLLMNLVRPTRGGAGLGVDSRRLGVAEFRRIGYVSENQQLPDWMTVDQLLGTAGRCIRPGTRRCPHAASGAGPDHGGDAAAAVARHPNEGRAATALAFRPELVVLDEPFTGLDPVVRDELVRALLEMPGERPFSVLVSSHESRKSSASPTGWASCRTAGWPCRSRSRRCSSVPVDRGHRAGSGVRFRRRGPVARAGMSGRTLRFIDTDHRSVDAETRIRTSFAGAKVRATPMTLREIFIALARPAARRGGRMNLTLHLSENGSSAIPGVDRRRGSCSRSRPPRSTSHARPPPGNPGCWSRWEPAAALAWVAALLLDVILVGLVVHAHPLVGSDAFWMTRPIPPVTLMLSKVVLLSALFLVVRTLSDIAIMAAYDLPAGWIARVAAESILTRSLWLLALMAAPWSRARWLVSA